MIQFRKQRNNVVSQYHQKRASHQTTPFPAIGTTKPGKFEQGEVRVTKKQVQKQTGAEQTTEQIDG